jgi:hypothetical protein
MRDPTERETIMIRNLKPLWLCLAALTALSVATASGASAQSPQGELTTTGVGGVTLTGTEAGLNALTFLGRKVECKGSTFTGHKITTTPHTFIPNKSTEITITPHYKNCRVSFTSEQLTTVTMTSCDSRIKIGETTGGAAHTYGVRFSVTCTTAGDTIDIEAYPFAGSELGGVICTTKIEAQENLVGLHVTTNTASGDFNVNGTVTGIHAQSSGSGCATEETSAMEQHVNLTFKAKDSLSNPASITVTDTSA